MKSYPEGLKEFAQAVCEKYSVVDVNRFIRGLLLTATIDDPFNPRHRRFPNHWAPPRVIG